SNDEFRKNVECRIRNRALTPPHPPPESRLPISACLLWVPGPIRGSWQRTSKCSPYRSRYLSAQSDTLCTTRSSAHRVRSDSIQQTPAFPGIQDLRAQCGVSPFDSENRRRVCRAVYTSALQ